MGSRLTKFKFKPEENEQIEAIVKVPREKRSIIHGIVKDYDNKLVKDAVVKLFELVNPPHNIRPITHTFTDECGQFIFGPLLPNKCYVIKVWINDVKIRRIMVPPDNCEDNFDYISDEVDDNCNCIKSDCINDEVDDNCDCVKCQCITGEMDNNCNCVKGESGKMFIFD
jgi:hypothetical protein